MLDTLRKNASGWVAQIFIGLLVLSFAVWGINDIFTGNVDTTVAEVGGEEIPGELFLFEYRQNLRERSQNFGRQLTLNEGQALGFDRQVLERMVGRTLLDVEARNLGLAASEELVLEDIRNDPAFAGPTGRFDPTTFQQVLFANGISEAFLVNDRQSFIRRQQLVDAVGGTVRVPEGFAAQMYAILNERRVARYVVLTPEMVDAPADPDAETLQAFYEERAAALYQEPETRAFSYVVMTPQAVANTIEIPEEELRDEYSLRKSEFDRPEERVIEQITFDTRDDAQAALARLAEGQTFAAIADAQGLTDEDYRLGSLTRDQLFSEEIAEAAFSLESGGVSEPVEGPLGWALVRVADITPAVESTFETARERIETDLALDRAYDRLFDLANEVEDARAGGLGLAESVAVLGLDVETVPPVSRSGLGPDGRAPDSLPEDPAILEAAFEAAPGEEAPMGETQAGAFFWVEVTEVNEARTRPLDEIRPLVVQTWKEEEREARLLRLAADLAARVNTGEPLAEVADDFDRAPIESQPLERGAATDTFSRIAVNNLFSVAEGEATYGPVGFGSSVVVMQAAEVIPGDPNMAGEAFTAFRDRLEAAMADDLMVQYVNALRGKLGATVNERALAYVIGGDQGEGGTAF